MKLSEHVGACLQLSLVANVKRQQALIIKHKKSNFPPVFSLIWTPNDDKHDRHMITIHSHLAVYSFFLLCACSVNAIEIELTENVKISGNRGSLSISPYQPSTLTNKSPSKPEHVLYAIDYDALKQEIKTYQQIYVTGQILHGYLMIKMKPKFVK